ncbi:DNA polymerase III subunit epsilon [Arthrobacter pityocampae]|uniref:DNA polymerase III subunit epsilon n=1 Tax=Arthrobacter pityocampae TaxID=547334 RepID=A0A2S5J1Y8_9MICC|nr:exonuclease domain-containing protein [Arthrobacter pityocampae]PPB50842.1 DNA polymerase III subunit epsilon [Arthrobacter pityocampae]
MTSWHEGPRAGFDLETTGRDPLTARIVTATIVLVDGNGRVLEHHEWLADPGIDIPEGAAAIHGVTTAHARAHGLPAGEVVHGISAVLARLFAAGIPVLAFNARYDFTVLAQEGHRHAVPVPAPWPVIDPYVMDKQADRYRRGKRTLTAMCEHYSIPFENAHTSAADVLATLRVGAVLAERFAFLRRPATDLHASLVVWADRQAANFEEYLRRTEPDAVIERAWPVIGGPDQQAADQQTAGQQTARQQTADHQTAGQQASRQQAADQPAADQQAADRSRPTEDASRRPAITVP